VLNKSWHGKRILPKIGNEQNDHKESENTADSPIPVTSLDRGITLLYHVDEANPRINDGTGTGDIPELQKERTFITKGSETGAFDNENEEYNESATYGLVGIPAEADDELPVEEVERLPFEAKTGDFKFEGNSGLGDF
jgi:hypothetical protein